MTASRANVFGIGKASRVVFVDAHPGSQIRTCGGAMLLSRRLGARLALIEACDGAAMVKEEADGLAMAVQRRKEVRSAVDILGLGQKNLVLLGFPDGGMEPLRADYWKPDGVPYFCPWLKTDRVTSPEAWRPGVRFFGREFHGLLKSVLRELRPTHVFVHHGRDTHMDHRAINWFVRKSLDELCMEDAIEAYPPLFEWITYYTRMPWPPRGQDIPLAAARKLPFPGSVVRYAPPAADQRVKVRAWRECLPSHGADYVARWTRTAEVFWVR